MASATLYDSRLSIELDGGMDPEGNSISKSKSFNNVKPTATNDQLYSIAQALVPLQQYALVSIERDNTFTLTA